MLRLKSEWLKLKSSCTSYIRRGVLCIHRIYRIRIVSCTSYFTLSTGSDAMAGTMYMLWFVTLFSGANSIVINGNECKSDRGIILKCTWKGAGSYIVNGRIKEEILILTKLTNAATLFIPNEFAGNLARIEVLNGDIPCRNIIAPLHIAVFVNKKRCVSKIYRNRKNRNAVFPNFIYCTLTHSSHPSLISYSHIKSFDSHQNTYDSTL